MLVDEVLKQDWTVKIQISTVQGRNDFVFVLGKSGFVQQRKEVFRIVGVFQATDLYHSLKGRSMISVLGTFCC